MQNTIYSPESRSHTEQTKESKWDNKQPIGKQHADKQSEVNRSHIGGKGKKDGETGKEITN